MMHFKASKHGQDLVNVDAIAEAARFVSRDWGDRYYAQLAAGDRYVCVLAVTAPDGSEFNVAADRWGNTLHITDEMSYSDALHALGEFAKVAKTP